MGNQASSCNPGSGSSTDSCTSRLHAAILQPSAVAKVLSLDGQVLHFTKSVKAIHVLLRHPNHCLCPAQSLRLSSSSSSSLYSPLSSPSSPPPLPCSLLPDDELQLGRIYILLPFHTFRLFLSAAAAHSHHRRQYRLSQPASRSRSCREQPTSHGEQPTSNQAQPTSNHAHLTQPTSVDQAQQTNHVHLAQPTASANPTSSLPTPSSNRTIHAQFIDSIQPQATSAQAQSTSLQEKPASSHLQASYRQRSQLPTNYSSQRRHRQIYNTDRAHKVHFPNLPPSSAARRSFEVQRPHSLDIRRCRSWRPRLQVITEMNSW